MHEELFQALDGVRVVYGVHTFGGSAIELSLRSGRYGNGRGAISVEADGEPYCVLTVNLPEEEIAPDEFFVRAGASSNTDYLQVRAVIAATRLFTATGRWASSGAVPDYASVWRFSLCTAHNGGRRVLCALCMKNVRQVFRAKLDSYRAADAAKRLGGRHL